LRVLVKLRNPVTILQRNSYFAGRTLKTQAKKLAQRRPKLCIKMARQVQEEEQILKYLLRYSQRFQKRSKIRHIMRMGV